MAQQPIRDLLIRDDQTQTIDLEDIFGPGSRDFTVTLDGEAVDVALADGVLTIDPLAFGHADIRISGLDAAGEAISDNFRVRVAGENAFTIAVLPDTQVYTSRPALNHIFGDMTQWLVDNKDSLGIEFVTHVGDVTDNNNAQQWALATEALRKMDGKIPYSILPGNHDQANGGSAANHSSDYLDTLFSPELQAAANPDTFGDVYDREPERGANSYHTFTAPDGTKWLMLSLEFAPRDDVVRWASEVVESHSDHRVVLSTHNYMTFSGRNDELPDYGGGPGSDYGLKNDPQGYNSGEDLWREFVSKYPNMAMVFSGHIMVGDGAETKISYTQHGNPVLQMLVNYQGGGMDDFTGGNGGNGAIRLLTIDPDNNTVYTDTYLLELDEYLDGYRGKPELDRDGLTGFYRGHQETITGIDFGPVAPRAQAKAGADLFIEAQPNTRTADVQLDGNGSLNGDLIAGARWIDERGITVATEIDAVVSLGAGRHKLTLEITDVDGRVTTDRKLVIVSDDNTLLMDNFNDGDANGWSTTLSQPTRFATASELGISAMPDGDPDVMAFPALPVQGRGYLVKPGFAPDEGGTINDYTIAFDVLIPSDNGAWFPFYQTDVTNSDDGELFVNKGRLNNGQWNGLGNSGSYHGNFTYDEWHRVVLVVTGADESQTKLEKYIDGVHVGTTVLGNPSSTYFYGINPETGFILFNDNTVNATSSGYVSSIMLTDKVMSHEEVAELGGVSAHGILTEQEAGTNVFQLDFNADDPFVSTFGGDGGLTLFDDAEGATGNWRVKGTHAAPNADEAAGEGELFDSSDAAGQLLLWNDADALGWKDYTYEASFKSTDIDNIGVVFYYTDPDNYYRLELNGRASVWTLVKVEGGQQTTLAVATQNVPYFDETVDVRVAVAGNRIMAFQNGQDLFGTVTVPDPLQGGTVGVYSDKQTGSTFDNIFVGKTGLTAHADAVSRAVDEDGNGTELVLLSADGSFGPTRSLSHSWFIDGEEVARGRAVEIEIEVGRSEITLVTVDKDGNVATDAIVVDVIGADALRMRDDFATDTLADGRWTFVDQAGSIGTSDWRWQEGSLVQLSDIASEQLVRFGFTDENIWRKGWSPLGDGVNVLRKGTIALYSADDAAGWSDYSVEATLKTTSTKDDNGIGFVFYYTDDNNYYKLELDSNDRNEWYSNAPIWNLVSVKDGIEEVIERNYGKYPSNAELRLRVDIVDHKIQAYVDGEAVFRDPIEDRKLDGGTFGLYTWDVAGVSFDDVRVISLRDGDEPAPVDTTAPTITAIRSLTEDAAADTVVFEITFDEAVTDIDAADFAIVADGLKDGYAIDKVEGAGSTWTVTVVGVSGNGSLALGLSPEVSIADLAGNALVWSDVSAGHDVESPTAGYEIVVNAFGGHDIFLHVADQLTPQLGTGKLDRVFYDGEAASVTLPDNIEQGTLLDDALASNLFGNELGNVLKGNASANVIKGGAGRDILTGGGGSDVFLYDAADQSGIRAVDRITDFSISEGDKVVFDDLGVKLQANNKFLFMPTFRDGILDTSLANMLSALTNDVAVATTAVASLMGENSVAGFRFDGDWYVVQTGERSGYQGGLGNPLSLLSSRGLQKLGDTIADRLAIENVVELDLVGTNTIRKLSDVVSFDLVA